jgi:hypothetical protein
MSDPFRSLFTREREFPSRVKTELEKRDRERLASITGPYPRICDAAFKELRDEVGYSKIEEATPNISSDELIKVGDSILVLSYLEHFLNILKDRANVRQNRNIGKDDYSTVVEKVYEVLITEGLLWDLEIKNNQIQFRQIESEAMEDIDQKVQALAEKEPWGDALKGYNDAFERYLQGDFDEQIPKKLYYSIEEVLKVICVDENNWTDNRELVHSKYLNMMKENDFYHAHGATVAELNQFLESLSTMVAKVSDDRKQRHAYHDRTYATLLIHQVGAYLYFLINRHKEYSA